MKIRSAAALAIASLLTLSPALSAQETREGTLQVLSGGRDVGRERYQARLSDSLVRITSRVTFAGSGPLGIETNLTVERSAGGELAFQLRSRSAAGGLEVLAVLQRNRLTIRRVERNVERASEMPGGRNLVLVADSSAASWLQVLPLTGPGGSDLVAVLLPSGRRLPFRAEREPVESGGEVIRFTGGLEGQLLLGPQGDLRRATLPLSNLEVVQVPD